MADLRGNRRQRPPPILDGLPSFSMAILACIDDSVAIVVLFVILVDVLWLIPIVPVGRPAGPFSSVQS